MSVTLEFRRLDMRRKYACTGTEWSFWRFVFVTLEDWTEKFLYKGVRRHLVVVRRGGE